MKSFFIAILCMSLLLCGLVSCNHTPSEVESATFDSLTIDTTKSLFSTSLKPACHLVIKMDVPVEPTPTDVREAIEQFISTLPKDGAFEEQAEGSVEGMCKAYAKSYILDYLKNGPEAIDNYGGDTLAAANWMSYEETVIGNVVYNAEGFLSYQVHTESFSGGAHGNSSVQNAVLNLKTQTPVVMSDLFSDVNTPALNELLRKTIVQQYDCQSMDELMSKGYFFSPEEIEVTENFYFDDKGITWMYDPYDIAPFSTGEVSVSLAWADLLPLLNDEAPVPEKVMQMKKS